MSWLDDIKNYINKVFGNKNTGYQPSGKSSINTVPAGDGIHNSPIADVIDLHNVVGKDGLQQIDMETVNKDQIGKNADGTITVKKVLGLTTATKGLNEGK